MSQNTVTPRSEREPARPDTGSLTAPLSRRSALRAALAAAGAAVLIGLPGIARGAEASAETNQKLSDAQSQLDAAQQQLDDISYQFEDLSTQLSDTMDQIESVQGQIDDTQASIDSMQAELDQKQEVLAQRVSSSYKTGDASVLSLLLSSGSFEELIANMHYVEKVNASDRDAIDEVRRIQDELAQQKASLEQQKADLESLKTEQTQQLDDMKAKKDEVQALLDNLSQEVKDLMAQRDAEILEAARQEELARQQASQSGGGGTTSIPGNGQASASGNAQQRVVNAAYSTPSPGPGLCAWWVADVFINAGFGTVPGNADDMYAAYCTSSNKSNLKVGMIIAVPSHPHTSAGRIYGHVGIYVGNNTVRDNIGYIRDINVDSWISYYGATSTPRWGWAKGINLEG
ncbi:coiled-coil domain-containing protein [Candidatus Collinsella stercoripullorum]|uniref:coiled-coil domain-containing protein n=1 Tax=Candidatus Collinsella stercoripullorum TaxID=2838522 RepID=UPI0022DF25E0|nr:CHAP domain-containing protein [Candidatus Collinsella stercoripullorum]